VYRMYSPRSLDQILVCSQTSPPKQIRAGLFVNHIIGVDNHRPAVDWKVVFKGYDDTKIEFTPPPIHFWKICTLILPRILSPFPI
jgi:hypothetical protein